ncbi:MAG TPA: YiiX/YebB-like N1pC/P60 family cysteine hydrolase [Anaeromyxobacteraceae bacterium]|nr:YiiX/YebB-like N1pC/P60 family cysteine hydrolase [Anaeromyxobacteraceae bacterium]
MLFNPAIACLAALALGVSARPPPAAGFRSGDLVFGDTRSTQSTAIQLATGSPWSHVGLVEVAPDGAYVIEAIGKVSRTPWAAFRRRAGGRVLVLRPRGIPDAARTRAVAEAKALLGRPYDPCFGWGDDRIYCSELVVKAYERGAGVSLGKRERLGDLHLAGLEAAIRARWGRVPRDLVLVTPASLAADGRLDTVAEPP